MSLFESMIIVFWCLVLHVFFFFSSRRRHTRLQGDWSSDVCSSDLGIVAFAAVVGLLLLVLDVLPARKDRWIALGLLAPAGLLLLVGLVVPAMRTMVLAFMNADSSEFVGLENFRWMFTDKNSGMLPDFGADPVQYGVLLSTLLWVLLVPTVSTAVGLVYAVLVDRARFESFAKSLVF